MKRTPRTIRVYLISLGMIVGFVIGGIIARENVIFWAILTGSSILFWLIFSKANSSIIDYWLEDDIKERKANAEK